MRKYIKYVIGAFVAIALMVMVITLVSVGGGEIKEGTYKILNSEDYPNAYIYVEENKIKFYNIDLNSLYQEKQMSDYSKMIEHGLEFNISEEQLKYISDLNEIFVVDGYEINYEEEKKDSKSGTFTYIYFCYYENTPFGLVIEYNSLNKTININNPIMNLTFKQ